MADLGWATLGEDRSELIEDKEREKQTYDDLETGSDWAWDWRWLRLRPAVRPCDGGGNRGQSLRLSPWVRVSERGWVREWERERKVRLWVKVVVGRLSVEYERNWGSRVFLVFIYNGFLVVLYLNGSVLGRVWQKPGPNPNPLWVFFLKDPYPTLLFIGSGKIRPSRVGPNQVPAGRAFIAIPSILVIFRFWRYFGYFLGFGGILVIF